MLLRISAPRRVFLKKIKHINMPKIPKIIYISGALTSISEQERIKLRKFYEELGEVCKEYDFESYIPHIYGDPKFLAHLSAAQIDRRDRLAVTQSYLIVAYVGIPSIGVGIEIELANHSNKPVILLYEKERFEQRIISRLVRGNPSIKHEIAFLNFEDAKEKLKMYLNNFLQEIKKEDLPPLIAV